MPQATIDNEPILRNDLGAGAGFLLLSLGAKRRGLIVNCIQSIRQNYPAAPIHAICDVPFDVPHTIVSELTDFSSRHYKTQLAALSPFEITVFIDDDTMIRSPFGTAAEMLGEADLALGQEQTMQSYYNSNGGAATTRSDIREMWRLYKDTPESPHFNSGVMIWRKSIAVLKLFEEWHTEWARWQMSDQPPLHCVFARRPDIKIKKLPARMNYSDWFSGRNLRFTEWDADIVHLHRKDRINQPQAYRQAMGIAEAKPGRVYDALRLACEKGASARAQYLAICRILTAIKPCQMLVFGCGNDSSLWQTANTGGRTLFAEDQPAWAAKAREAGCEVRDITYPTARGVDADASPMPADLAGRYDLIFVDGPRGDVPESPGRQLPIKWASESKGAVVALHDYDRPWERACADRYLGLPDFIVPGDDKRKSVLAIWFGGRDLREVLLR